MGLTMPTFSTKSLQKMAISISVLSIVYNGAEGAVSIYFGNEGSSIALLVFGIQSLVEIASATLVVWRFLSIALPGNESKDFSKEMLNKERAATIGIGLLLGLLSLGTIASSVYNLIMHQHPDTADFNLMVAGGALFFMILIWAPKPWLARELNSSAMAGEAKCSLSCMCMTVVLLIGSLIYKLWPGGWWVDSATAIALAIFFGKESVAMVRWGASNSFTGGCCAACQPSSALSCRSAENSCGTGCHGADTGCCSSSASCGAARAIDAGAPCCKPGAARGSSCAAAQPDHASFSGGGCASPCPPVVLAGCCAGGGGCDSASSARACAADALPPGCSGGAGSFFAVPAAAARCCGGRAAVATGGDVSGCCAAGSDSAPPADNACCCSGPVPTPTAPSLCCGGGCGGGGWAASAAADSEASAALESSRGCAAAAQRAEEAARASVMEAASDCRGCRAE